MARNWAPKWSDYCNTNDQCCDLEISRNGGPNFEPIAVYIHLSYLPSANNSWILLGRSALREQKSRIWIQDVILRCMTKSYPNQFPCNESPIKGKNNLRNRPRWQDGRLVIFRFVKPAQMLLWLAPRKCKLPCAHKALTTFDIHQHSWTTSLTVSHLHVSPCISPRPTLALILKRPRGSTTTSSRTCEAQQKQKIEEKLEIHNKARTSPRICPS